MKVTYITDSKTIYVWISLRTRKIINRCTVDMNLRFKKKHNHSNTVVADRVGYFVMLHYSYKSWSIIKTRDIFENCWSWRFQNTPCMSNLTKIWLRYLRLTLSWQAYKNDDFGRQGPFNGPSLKPVKMKLQRCVRSQIRGSWVCPAQPDYSQMATTCLHVSTRVPHDIRGDMCRHMKYTL